MLNPIIGSAGYFFLIILEFFVELIFEIKFLKKKIHDMKIISFSKAIVEESRKSESRIDCLIRKILGTYKERPIIYVVNDFYKFFSHPIWLTFETIEISSC